MSCYIDDSDVSKVNVLWDGADEKTNVQATDDLKKELFEFLDLFLQHSQENFPLVLTLISASRLHMHRRDLYAAGRKLANLFIVGKFGTGKSEIVQILGMY